MKSKRLLKIATRDSKLAVRQAEMVAEKLKEQGVRSELVFFKSKGDLSQKNPVQTIGSTGVFTKAIDDAVLKGKADIGVHSLKDLPTAIHPKLALSAVLKRTVAYDVIVFRDEDFTKKKNYSATVATGSARRKAQWLSKYPDHAVIPVRGNVDSRLKKLKESNWDGMILAAAGLKRLNIKVNSKKLDWMIPAPSQGAIAIVSKKIDKALSGILGKINHHETFLAVTAEREFLKSIGAGCSTPVGALAIVKNGRISFKGEVLSQDGKEKISVEISDKLAYAKRLGQRAAQIALKKGARKLLA